MKDPLQFSIGLALALSEKFHIMEWVCIPRRGMDMEYVELNDIVDFIEQFIRQDENNTNQ